VESGNVKRIMPFVKIIIGAVVSGLTRAFVAEELDSRSQE
jgi:hypothetical protein